MSAQHDSHVHVLKAVDMQGTRHLASIRTVPGHTGSIAEATIFVDTWGPELQGLSSSLCDAHAVFARADLRPISSLGASMRELMRLRGP